MSNRLGMCLAFAAALSAAPVATAETIHAVSSFGPNHPIAVAIYPEISLRLKEFTNGAWDLQDAPADVSPNRMGIALRDGTVDFGALVLPYFAADYAEATLPSELSLVSDNSPAISAAVTEYIVTCPECLAEFAKNGQVYLGSDATPPYNLLTVKPIRGVADLSGVRIRTGAPLFADFIKKHGGVPVQLPSSDFADALRRGAVAGTFDSNAELSMNESRKPIGYVTPIELGVYNGAVPAAASHKLWERMTPEARVALVRASQYGIAKGVARFRDEAEAARKLEGITFVEMDDSLKQAKRKFVDGQLSNAARILENRGVTDAQAKIYRYIMLLGKWETLLSQDMTAEDVAKLRYDQIFGKLDMSTYAK